MHSAWALAVLLALTCMWAAVEAAPTYLPTKYRKVPRPKKDPTNLKEKTRYRFDGKEMVEFKMVDMEFHAQDPVKYPFFSQLPPRDIASQMKRYVTPQELHDYLTSTREDCGDGMFTPNVGRCNSTNVYPTRPTGFLFHESRCGSTLSANILSAIPRSIVYGEITTQEGVLLGCRGCSREEKLKRYKDIIMSALRVPGHDTMFIKLVPDAIHDMELVLEAFPDTPWMYLSRDGLEVTVSNKMRPARGGGPYHTTRQRFPTSKVAAFYKDPHMLDPSHTEICIAQLVAYREKVLDVLSKPIGRLGTVIDYSQQPFAFIEALQDHFGVALSDETLERMGGLTHSYSKAKSDHPKNFTAGDDAKKKHDQATHLLEFYNAEVLEPLRYRLLEHSWSALHPHEEESAGLKQLSVSSVAKLVTVSALVGIVAAVALTSMWYRGRRAVDSNPDKALVVTVK